MKITRRNSPPIKVYCLPREKERIEDLAKAAGMSSAAYLREVGQGYRVTGVTDYENVRKLAKVNGDLGRLGGLLKLWLTDDVKTANFRESTIVELLNRIESNQEEMSCLMKCVLQKASENFSR